MPSLILTGGSEARLSEEAVSIAAGLLCHGHQDAARCPDCRRVSLGTHPDFFKVEPDGVQIKVERVREAVRFAVGRPYEAPRRVAWIDSADRLGEAAANALLKSLEEPGERMTWLLTTTRPDQLLATIRSRCELHRLAPLSPEKLRAGLSDAGCPDGDLADAIAFGLEPSRLESLEELRSRRRLILAALSRGSLSALLSLSALGDDEGWAMLLSSLLRDAALVSSGVSLDRIRHTGAAAELRRVASGFPAAALAEAAARSAEIPAELDRYRQKKLVFEGVLLALFQEGGKETFGGK